MKKAGQVVDIKVLLPMLVSNGIGRLLEPSTGNPSFVSSPFMSSVHEGSIVVLVFEPLMDILLTLDTSEPSTTPVAITKRRVKKKNIIKGLKERHLNK